MVQSTQNNEMVKKRVVRFYQSHQIQYLYVWGFAYREARKGLWGQVALDRYRFNRRIIGIESIISTILSADHRTKNFRLRFQKFTSLE